MYAGDVRISPTVSSPATVFSTILVPANFASWSLPEREAALAHERAHIENKDFHVQALAQLHRHLFWFNPLAWWLPRRLALLSEHLSDDAALAASSNAPAAYAELLIACARKSLHGEQAVAMAGTSTLASRIDRILDGKRCSVRVNRWAFVGMAAALIPLAASAATFKAQSEQEALLPRTGSALGQQLPVTRATSGNVVLPHSNQAWPLSQPVYPPVSRQLRETGTVVLKLHVLEDGSVADAAIHMSSGYPSLDYAAMYESFRWKLSPGTVDGQPQRMWGRFAVTFKLSK